MARIRDLGINALPITIRPLEIGPGAVAGAPVAQATPWRLQCEPSNCDVCPCGENSTRGDTSLICIEATQCVPTRREPEPGYHASGFTLEAVAELRQQIQTRRKELDH